MKEMELTLREELFPNWITYALLLIIIILSVLKNEKELVIVHIKNAFLKAPSTQQEAKDNLSFASKTNWLMLVSYFVVSGIAVYMLLIYFKASNYWLMILPTGVYFFQLFSLYLMSVLSGESKKLRDNILLLNLSAHLLGIVLIPLLIIWLLNPHFSEHLVIVLASVAIVFYLIRLVRGVLLAIRNKVLWYYIILYLCALEIWPIIVGCLLLSPVFIG